MTARRERRGGDGWPFTCRSAACVWCRRPMIRVMVEWHVPMVSSSNVEPCHHPAAIRRLACPTLYDGCGVGCAMFGTGWRVAVGDGATYAAPTRGSIAGWCRMCSTVDGLLLPVMRRDCADRLPHTVLQMADFAPHEPKLLFETTHVLARAGVGADGCIRPAHVHPNVVADGGERVLQTAHAAHQVGPDAQQISLDRPPDQS